MTNIGRSNNDVIAEAVAAIGPYKAWIAARRAEIKAQIAQMQAASAATTTTATGDNSLASRFRQVVLPPRTSGTPSAPLPAAPEVIEVMDTPMTVTADTASPHATTPEGVAETAQVARTPISEEPVSVTTASTVTAEATLPAALPTPQNAKEAQAYLDTVFAATPPQTLPPVVVEAWGQRSRNAVQCTKVLVAAQDAGVLPDAVAHAVTSMIALDSTYGAVANAYRLGMYKDLVGLFTPTVPGPDEQEDDAEDDAEQDDADEEDEDVTEGDGNEDAGEERQWGFPGEDSRESPF